jgi:hypothetical protein
VNSQNNTDLFRDSADRVAQQWRAAAEASRAQFPEDADRLKYYLSRADFYENIAKERFAA